MEVLHSISGFYPEIALCVVFLILIVTDLIFHTRFPTLVRWLALAGIGVVGFLSVRQFQTDPNTTLFGGLLHNTPYIIFFKCLFSCIAFLTIVFSSTEQSTYSRRGEFLSILIAITLGLHLMIMGRNLLMLYLAIELVSIGSYIFTFFLENKKSAAGSLRYILFGAMSSGIMLYGISWLYGLTGSLDFQEASFWAALANQPTAITATVLVLTMSGFLFKASVVPFHVWTPDVYDSAPIAIVAFFSIAPKAAALLVILFIRQAASIWHDFQVFILILAFASITIGNFSALWQTNIRRMLAYSSIAHMGFLFIGLVIPTSFAIQSMTFYIVVYVCMNFAAFLCLSILEKITGSTQVAAYHGLGFQYIGLGIIVVCVMIALIGLPPTAGFTAKLLLFSSLWENYQQSEHVGILLLFIWGLFNTLISVFYYLKIPYFFFFKKVNHLFSYKITLSESIVLILVSIPIVVLFFKSDLLVEFLVTITR